MSGIIRQRVLIMQTAQPSYVKRAMESILAKNILGPARLTLFCRALPDELSQFRDIVWIDEFLVHHETRSALAHLRRIRRERFDVIIAFFSRETSYWKLKLFVFLCRGQRVLVFNEHLGCFYLTPSTLIRFSKARWREWRLRHKQKLGYALGTSQGFIPPPSTVWLTLLRPFHLLLKIAIFPFRLAYLLVWTSLKLYRRRRCLQRLNAPDVIG